MKPFSIECLASDAGVVEVKVCGFLDAHTVTSFEKAMEDLLSQDHRKILMDLAELTYISSAGIGALMVLLQQLRRRQGDMVILNPTPKVFKIMDLLGFTKIFNISQDRGAALSTLS